MNIVVAPDSFKGSLSSVHVSEAMRDAFLSVNPKSEVVLKPMADGGEGTLDALSKATNGRKVPFACTGPLGEASNSWYVELDNCTAVIEGAIIAGLPLVPEAQQNPDWTTSYGIGEAIIHALDRGNTSLILTLGGSSTNDGGLGLLQALGMKAMDTEGNKVGNRGKDLFAVADIDISQLDPRLQTADIQVACDVDNPLTGENGASYVYGPQKGADATQIQAYDQALNDYGLLIEKAFDRTIMNHKGAGAAGGLGFALLAVGGGFQSGAKLVADAIGLPASIQRADLIVTGEGESNHQTLYGKAPGYVAELAQRYNKPVLLISGSLTGDIIPLNKVFTGCFGIPKGPMSLEKCLDQADRLVFQTTQQLAFVLDTFR
ncbi:glycerate kinase [Thalassobacillus sp. CUG 92003]|uniref:glycerate kinase n=1 Tax=Thalassobacillus sp. CUG 92003 TaxID=2736641 RepID=UPI0015E78347|nr:glycerate kinase [Thalassobacillus sp. CUG 92003]